MQNKSEYIIKISGLKSDIQYSFEFKVGKDFFENYNNLSFSFNLIDVIVNIEKKMNLFILNIIVDGFITTNCDRCTSLLDFNIYNKLNLILKTVVNPDEMNEKEQDPDIFYVSFTEHELDIKNWVNDLILISIPAVKQCNEKGEGKNCNQDVLKYIINS